MKRENLLRFAIFICFLILVSDNLKALNVWKASWISEPNSQNATNSWYCFRKDFTLDSIPAKAIAKIAVDTKYWLWVNGKLSVFEGGLKRGPGPADTYYDEIDITSFLGKGKNSISVLVWYFGKDGFSHISSGKAGFLFECIDPGIEILSDRTWKVRQHPAYETCLFPFPNFRLPESSIRFDARRDTGFWQDKDFNTVQWSDAGEIGVPPVAPWNNLILRPIPQWKNSGLMPYINNQTLPAVSTGDSLVCILPSNIQMTPYLKVEAPEGLVIAIHTDDFYGGSAPNVRAEYVTRKGVQEYESFGWMNGHKVIYIIPKGVKILELRYRETGFNTDFAGSFKCSDNFLNRLWEKSQRTLYLTMRDNYMDCPDRERAQWWGDEVNESGEAFYALSPSSHSLFRKGIYELINWQRNDSTLFSPVPAGNWKQELPAQMLSSVGYYGFWNYYLHTGDKQPIADLYNGVRKYLKVWKLNDKGLIVLRSGGWSWGDWGDNIDLELILNTLYYLALRGASDMAGSLGLTRDVSEYNQTMSQLKLSFNKYFWTGKEYRHPDYKDKTDDRSQALAVVSGLAGKDKYPAILQVLKTEEHASPYMEKYVLEALFQMGYPDYALQRMKKRFGDMVNNPDYTTLFEGWGIGSKGFGGGTTNHAWSGGGLTILSQYLCGIAPIDPGYSTFQIIPQPGSVAQASATILSVKGEIKSAFVNKPDRFDLSVIVPDGTSAIIGLPDKGYTSVKVGGKSIWSKGKYTGSNKNIKYLGNSTGAIMFKVTPGKWNFIAGK